MTVIGRRDDRGPTVHLGRYRARDGSAGARVDLDLDQPHVGVVVGKRGSGKSYTLGVLAEGLAAAPGVVPVVVDPMGAFRTLAAAPVGAHVTVPSVDPAGLDPRAWCRLLDLDPSSGPGSLCWRAAERANSLDGMATVVGESDVPAADRRSVANHLALADSWGVFDRAGLDACALASRPTVLDLAGVDRAPAAAVLASVADLLYEARVDRTVDAIPWLLVDEAHALLDGVAGPSTRRLLTRGRHPGVGVVLATQRPSALPAVAPSQADLVLAHRLTDRADREALAAMRPSYVEGRVVDRLPTRPGAAMVVDDATESAHAIQVRERQTPHGGATPRASTADEADRVERVE